MIEAKVCQGKTSKGDDCNQKAKLGSNYCHKHIKEQENLDEISNIKQESYNENKNILSENIDKNNDKKEKQLEEELKLLRNELKETHLKYDNKITKLEESKDKQIKKSLETIKNLEVIINKNKMNTERLEKDIELMTSFLNKKEIQSNHFEYDKRFGIKVVNNKSTLYVPITNVEESRRVNKIIKQTIREEKKQIILQVLNLFQNSKDSKDRIKLCEIKYIINFKLYENGIEFLSEKDEDTKLVDDCIKEYKLEKCKHDNCTYIDFIRIKMPVTFIDIKTDKSYMIK